jgi:hypothetical protein
MDKIRLIESYLDGGMSVTEREQFEKLLEEDSELASELALHKNVNEAILDEETVRFRVAVRRIIEEKTSIPRKFLHALKYPLAASILILIGLSLWQLFFLKKSPAELYLSYYKPYHSDISTRSTEESKNTIDLACMLYQEGDFESSFSMLQDYLHKNSDNLVAHFYLGLSAMELNMYNLAIEEFKIVEQDPVTPFAIHARWYLAMSFIQLGQVNDALHCLNVLSKEENLYSEKASAILKRIKI